MAYFLSQRRRWWVLREFIYFLPSLPKRRKAANIHTGITMFLLCSAQPSLRALCRRRRAEVGRGPLDGEASGGRDGIGIRLLSLPVAGPTGGRGKVPHNFCPLTSADSPRPAKTSAQTDVAKLSRTKSNPDPGARGHASCPTWTPGLESNQQTLQVSRFRPF
jgi:hypothetical protein